MLRYGTILLAVIFSRTAFAADPTSEALCRGEFPFQSCYGVTHVQCLEWADAAVKSCIREMPPRPSQPTSLKAAAHSEWGEWNVELGHCAERFYELNHRDAVHADQACTQALNQVERRKTNYKHTNGGFRYFGLSLPILFGIGFSVLILRPRARRGRVTIFAGLTSWLGFLFGCFFGELVSHILMPEAYANVGDNPGQIIGLTIGIMLSFVLNPLLWLYFRFTAQRR